MYSSWAGNGHVPQHEDPSGFLAGVPAELFIGGRWRPAADGRTFGVEDPATGRELCRVADATARRRRGRPRRRCRRPGDWARTAPRERGEILRRAFELVTSAPTTSPC